MKKDDIVYCIKSNKNISDGNIYKFGHRYIIDFILYNDVCLSELYDIRKIHIYVNKINFDNYFSDLKKLRKIKIEKILNNI